MTRRYVQVTHRGWGSRLAGSLVGVLIGLLLFPLSFVVLWVNEGRTDLSKVAADSIPISASAVDPSVEGKFVAAAGVLASDEELGDPGFLQPAAYVQLSRQVEMYAWEEESDTETERTIGGDERTTTEYTYEKVWTSNPEDSSDFEYEQSHQNPEMRVPSEEFTVRSATVGAYRIDPQEITLPGGTEVRLARENVIEEQGELVGDYIFIGSGTLANPEIGDLRIKYTAVLSGLDVTVFGKARGDQIVPYVYQGKTRLYRAFTSDRESAIATLSSEHQMISWLLRLAGFLMMWIGLGLVLGPISTFLDVLPVLGNLSRGAIGLLTFAVALALSIVTIVIAIIAHSLVLLILLLALIVGAAFLRSRRKAGARAPAGPPVTPTPAA